ncbi:MAG: DNA-binding protein [Burkholderiales bacterium]|nr:DNA-binding protein [Burkholderiales bacterium]
MTNTTPPSGPISLADVRQALADTDPSSTNAGALRKLMGRGSYATIQKHLDAIRQERAPVVPVAPGTTPAPPADAVAAIWGAAYAAAQVLTLGRLETVTAERDAARLVAAQAQDVASLAAEVDAGAETVTAALSAKQQLETTVESHQGEIARLTGELERVTREAAAAAELAQREAQIKLQTLQTVLDKAIHEVSDYKSLLARLTPSKG